MSPREPVHSSSAIRMHDLNRDIWHACSQVAKEAEDPSAKLPLGRVLQVVDPDSFAFALVHVQSLFAFIASLCPAPTCDVASLPPPLLPLPLLLAPCHALPSPARPCQ
eukprot:8615629-Alexandrium_andersonii.AAC.1